MKKPAKDVPRKKPPALRATPPASRTPAVPTSVPVTAACPIVGVGASAGGLEAIEAFLKNVPADSGMAFVILQHLDPTHKGMMAELDSSGGDRVKTLGAFEKDP